MGHPFLSDLFNFVFDMPLLSFWKVLAFQYQKESCQSSMSVPHPFDWWQLTDFADIMQTKLSYHRFCWLLAPPTSTNVHFVFYLVAALVLPSSCVTCFRHQQIIIACSSPMPKNRWGRGSYNAIVLSGKMRTNTGMNIHSKKGEGGDTCYLTSNREKNHAIPFLFN